MKKGKQPITIDDNSIYQYFDDLIYKEEFFRKKGWKKEENSGSYGLTDQQVQTIYGSKKVLYGQEDAKNQLNLIQTFQRFLHEYIGIRGLEELLVNNYGTIENSIFFEYDSYGRPKNIREHSKHQMKNAYLGSVLLLDCGYLQDIAKTISQERSETTKYLVDQARRVLKAEKKSAVGKYPEGMNAVYTQDMILGNADICEKLEEWAYKIFLLSSLFHDIGYPLEYYLRTTEKLSDYPPHLKILRPAAKTDFTEIKMCLLESRLFQQIDHESIRVKYLNDNHGALSAISLLLHFYYSGKIYSLSTEKRCLIEMTAIAIYRHTDKFSDGTRMVYMNDPISYMVRLCDDLQEWNRFKLQINEKHNYLQCDECGKILLEEKREYICSGCGRKYYKVTQLENRKVNYISLCDGLEITYDDQKVNLRFLFSYMKQIEVLLDDYAAVLKNCKSFYEIDSMLKNQKMTPQMHIDYFLSNNPLIIIEEMINNSAQKDKIEKWIREQEETEKGKNLKAFYDNYNSLIKHEPAVFGEKLEKNELKYRDKVRKFVRSYYGEIYSLYYFLQTME